MTDTNQLPPLPNTSKLFEDDNNIVIGYTADQMRDYALQAIAQVQGEPVLFIHPATFSMNQAHVGAWKPGHELPGYLPLYTTPQPVQAKKETP